METTYKKNKNSILISLGAFLEYYDFIIFGLLAKYIAINFFNDQNISYSYAKTFMIFSTGYLARLLGTFVFCTISDKFGRKNSILITMGLMSFSTFSIAILPTNLGFLGCVLLTIFRILQGISYGAEIPIATSYLNESYKKNYKFHFGILISGTSLGSLMAFGIISILKYFISEEQFISYGWRIPFIIGSFLGIVCYFSRKQLIESPEFLKTNQQTKLKNLPFVILFKTHKKILLKSFLCLLFPAFLIIINIYMPTFLSHKYQIDSFLIYSAQTISLFWSIFVSILTGYILSKTKNGKSIFYIILSYTLFAFLCAKFDFNSLKNLTRLTMFFVIFQTFITSAVVTSLAIATNYFDVSTKSSGIGISYNLAFLISTLSITIVELISNIILPTIAIFGTTILVGIFAIIFTTSKARNL